MLKRASLWDGSNARTFVNLGSNTNVMPLAKGNIYIYIYDYHDAASA